MNLREDLDVAGQREHRPSRLAEHELCDGIRLGHHGVAGRHRARRERFDAPKQFLVLELLVAEAHERLERDLIAEAIVAVRSSIFALM